MGGVDSILISHHPQPSSRTLAGALPVTLCGVARHCLVYRCTGSTSDPLWGS